ncbi:MAG: hypothetical protein EOP08_01795, partial [Proteobacteria bacterium]
MRVLAGCACKDHCSAHEDVRATGEEGLRSTHPDPRRARSTGPLRCPGPRARRVAQLPRPPGGQGRGARRPAVRAGIRRRGRGAGGRRRGSASRRRRPRGGLLLPCVAGRLGADHVIDYRADASWGESALAWTKGRGVDVVVEVGGPATFDQSVAAARPGGVLSLIGVLTGFGGEIAIAKVFQKRLQVHGIYVGSSQMLDDTVQAFARNRLEPVIDRVFDFDEARAA